jgi:hypothetical protein
MMRRSFSYRTRPIRHLETWEHDGWRLKVYGISAAGERPAAELIAAIKRQAASTLPQPAITAARYGIGFLYAHQGREGGGFASVNWWGNENELFHYQYEASADAVQELLPIEQTGGSSACVWDIAVIAHERQAWVDYVLANEAGPDVDAYLSAVMHADV